MNVTDIDSGNLIPAPIKELPVTGVPITGLRRYASLPSRKSAERDLSVFINECMRSDRIYGCVIKAWWGEGKTEAYENFIKPEVKRLGQDTYDVTATTIARIFERNQKEGKADPVVWRAFLSALFEALWEEGKIKPKGNIPLKRQPHESDREYIERILQLVCKNNKTFIFIDEVEQLEPRESKDEILLGIRGLFDQKEETLRGNIHLIMACTPDAFNRLVSSSTQMGGLIERLKIIDLPRPTDEEAIRFIYGLVDYIYDGKLPDTHPFLNSGSAYAIMNASHKSPRGMIKILQQVIAYSRMLADQNGHSGYMYRIDGNIIVHALRNYNIGLFGTQVPALDNEPFERILKVTRVERDSKKTKKIQNLLTILIGEPIPHSIGELCSRIKIPERFLKDIVSIINNRVMESDLFDRWLILPLIEVRSERKPLSETLKKFLLSFLFYDRNGSLSRRNFIPMRYQAIMSISPRISMIEAQKIERKLLTYSSGTIYYLLSPRFLQHLYPNPDFLELSFIRDKNKRLELWKEAYERIHEKDSPILIEDSLLDLLKKIARVGSYS